MEKENIVERYTEFLTMNKLTMSEESAREFCDMCEGISPLILSMEFARAADAKEGKDKKLPLFKEALLIYPSNFAAKTAIMDLEGKPKDEYKALFDLEYNRLLKEDYMNPIYYKDGKIDFKEYQETMNYLIPLRNYFIRLIFDGKWEEALSVGEQIQELNPSDLFSNNSILAFLYLKFNDVKSAYEIVDNDSKNTLGLRELVYAYSCFLNLDTEECLGYIDRMSLVNPNLYRMFTGELGVYENYTEKDYYADSLYTYLNFSAVLLDNDSDFYKIIDESKKTHPLMSVILPDEKVVLEAGYLSSLRSWTLDGLSNDCKNVLSVPEFYTFTTGRLNGILESLTARGILFKDKLTPYGELFIKEIKALDDKKSEDAYTLAEKYLEDGKKDEGLKLLAYASMLAPSDFVIRGEYYIHKDEISLDSMESYLKEMESEYIYDVSHYEFKDYILRKNCKKMMYKVGYKYFTRVFTDYISKQKDYEMTVPSVLPMYKNYSDLFNGIYKEDSFKNTDIYKLYSDYKNTKVIDHDLLVKIIKGSILEYSYMKSGFSSLYSIIDPDFGASYMEEVKRITLDEILSSEELEFLKGVRDDVPGSVKIGILERMDNAELISSTDSKNRMALSDIAEEYFKNKDKNQ